jgi:hypothetical protein
MGFLPGVRFQKRVSVLPGVKINLSKSGASTSIGGKGASVNLGLNKRMINLGIPGTGLSYRVPLNGTMLAVVIAAVAIVGIAYLIAPGLVGPLLHAWQPQWF